MKTCNRSALGLQMYCNESEWDHREIPKNWDTEKKLP